MARNWIVLTAARGGHAVNTIIAYTEWDDYVALVDEVVYTDPLDAGGSAADALWKVSGTVTLAGGVYTYADSGLEPSLEDRQRGQIFDAYLYWRIFGRTNHWAGIRRDLYMDSQYDALDGTDKWALHIVALVDQVIRGTFPIGGYTAEQVQAFVDHAVNILRTQGPAWYGEQFETSGEPKDSNNSYRGMGHTPGTTIYTDICTTTGVLRSIDGSWVPMPAIIHADFQPEDRLLGA